MIGEKWGKKKKNGLDETTWYKMRRRDTMRQKQRIRSVKKDREKKED